MLARGANLPLVSSALKTFYEVRDPRLQVSVAGITFPNPIGLAAGFDKNAALLGLWSGIGFGHIEVGTVTGRAQPGNPRPRIVRFPDDHALINRMGFPSRGADYIQHHLKRVRSSALMLSPVGINIGKSKAVDLDRATEDYLYSFERLAHLSDYVAVNVSSPNTAGLRQLQDRERLVELLQALQGVNRLKKPIFLKVSPDLTCEALEDAVRCCADQRIDGVIATNTTLGRAGLSVQTAEAGGLSGAPLTARALEVVQFLGRIAPKGMALIGVGGVSNGPQLLSMLAAGAQMVQVYTGLVYEGPGLVRSLNQFLLRFMEEHGCATPSEAGEVWGRLNGSRGSLPVGVAEYAHEQKA